MSRELHRALEFAHRYLNRRERTAYEVRRHLEGRGIGTPVASEAVATLTDRGAVDDARFARLFVEDMRTLQQWGSERIRRRLLTRGVEAELVEQALAEADVEGGARPGSGESGTDAELGRALRLLERRFPDPPRDRRQRDRALGVLIRRGYDPELSLAALAAHGCGEREPR